MLPRPFPTGLQDWLRIMGNQDCFSIDRSAIGQDLP